MRLLTLMLAVAAVGLLSAAVHADETVTIGGVNAVLIKPRRKATAAWCCSPAATAISASAPTAASPAAATNSCAPAPPTPRARLCRAGAGCRHRCRRRGQVHGGDQAAGDFGRHQPRHAARRRRPRAGRASRRAGAHVRISLAAIGREKSGREHQRVGTRALARPSAARCVPRLVPTNQLDRRHVPDRGGGAEYRHPAPARQSRAA